MTHTTNKWLQLRCLRDAFFQTTSGVPTSYGLSHQLNRSEILGIFSTPFGLHSNATWTETIIQAFHRRAANSLAKRYNRHLTSLAAMTVDVNFVQVSRWGKQKPLRYLGAKITRLLSAEVFSQIDPQMAKCLTQPNQCSITQVAQV